MTTNINVYSANINGTKSPLINTFSDIFIYTDTNTHNLPKISSIPFQSITMNGIADLDPSGGLILINPGIYKIDIVVSVSSSNNSEGNNNSFNTALTTSFFNGTTNSWSNVVPVIYYSSGYTTNPNLMLLNVIAQGDGYSVGPYTGLNYNFSGSVPTPYIVVQYKSNNESYAYLNYLSISYTINSKLSNQTIYFTSQVPGSNNATLYLGLVTATVQLINTNYIDI